MYLQGTHPGFDEVREADQSTDAIRSVEENRFGSNSVAMRRRMRCIKLERQR